MARDTPLGFPAHTLPYRRGEFTTLSTVSQEACQQTRLLSACRKSFFSPLNKFSEHYKSSENLGFQWRRETGEAPPVADQASLFRGRLPISGYEVSADWLEPTVYPLLGFPRTPFTRKGYAASVKRRSR